MRPIVVLKFGGTSVADAGAVERAAGIVRASRTGGADPVVVTSALAGVTDGLLVAVRRARDGDVDGAGQELDGLLARHGAVAESVLGPAPASSFRTALAEAERTMRRLLDVVRDHPGTRGPLQDEIVSYGERLSSLLLAGAIRETGLPGCWVDGRECIRTDARHGRAEVLRDRTRERTRQALLPRIERRSIPVLGGFIGSTEDGATTTLGRGGSDLSAALVGAALGAAEIQIWTDVNGFLTADPRIVAGARPIARLSYAEAAELAYFGAKVLHPRTIQPAVEGGIAVRVCNSYEPDAPGTLIDARSEASPGGIKAIAHKRSVTVVRVTAVRMLGAYGFLRSLFELFDRHHVPVDIVATSEVSVSLTVDDADALPALLAELDGLGEVLVEREHAIVCVVGEELRSTPGIAARVFGVLRDINIVLVSQGASTTNLTFVVSDDAVGEVVTRLHDSFFAG